MITKSTITRLSLGTLTLITMCMTMVLPAQASGQKRPMDGFFLGVQGEYALLDLSGDYSLVSPTPIRATSKVEWDSNEAAIGLAAGWGKYIDNFYLGVEASYSFYTGDVDTIFISAQDKEPLFAFEISNNYKVQLASIVGIGLSENTLLYGKLGAVYTDIEVAAYTFSFTDDYYSVGAVHDWIGGMAGIGIAHNISGNIALRAEYTVTTYFIGPTYDNDKNDGEETDYDFYDNRFIVGLVYTF